MVDLMVTILLIAIALAAMAISNYYEKKRQRTVANSSSRNDRR
jgi:cell division protein FtsL